MRGIGIFWAHGKRSLSKAIPSGAGLDRLILMMKFTSEELNACGKLIQLALAEDLGAAGDRTSQVLIPEGLTGQARFVARRAGIVAGLPAVAAVLAAVDARLTFQERVEDGSSVLPGTCLADVCGPVRGILAAERTGLNFLQRLSGVATQTRRYVEQVAGLLCRILDTRKTTPGWRLLEKYAVRCGGGLNHRLGLYDGMLVKDNHLAALGTGKEAFRRLASALSGSRVPGLPLEIEVEQRGQLEGAFACLPEIVLLDNMTLDQLREAVRLRNEKAPNVLLEASGGVTLETVRAIAETGVDRISVGALTHSAPALDIALDYLPDDPSGKEES
jgi:nicotinate-nucleotide pyrophosphorylase (carboxylating)